MKQFKRIQISIISSHIKKSELHQPDHFKHGKSRIASSPFKLQVQSQSLSHQSYGGGIEKEKHILVLGGA